MARRRVARAFRSSTLPTDPAPERAAAAAQLLDDVLDYYRVTLAPSVTLHHGATPSFTLTFQPSP